MKEINNLLQRFFCLFLTGNIFKCYTCFFLDISFGTTLANSHNSTSAFIHPAHKKHQHEEQYYGWKQYAYHSRNKFTHSIRLFIMENNICSLQTFGQCICILHLIYLISCILIRFLDLRNYCQYTGLKGNFLYLILFYHFDKFIISDLAGLVAHHICHKA